MKAFMKLELDKRGQQQDSGDTDADGNAYNLRKLNNLIYHLVQSANKQTLKEVLCDFNWMFWRIKATDVDSLMDDWEMAGQADMLDDELKLLHDVLKLSRDSLLVEPKQLSTELPGRLLMHDMSERPHLRGLLQQAEKPPYHGMVLLQGNSKVTGSMLVQKFAGHPELICATAISESKELVASACTTYRTNELRMWNVNSAKQLKVISNVTDNSAAEQLLFANKDQWAVILTQASVFVYDWSTKKQVKKIVLSEEPYQDCSKMTLANKGKTLLLQTTEFFETYSIPDFSKKWRVMWQCEKTDPPVYGQEKHFLAALGDTAVFKAKESPHLHFFKLSEQKSGSKLKVTNTQSLPGNAQSTVYRVAMTCIGLVATLHYKRKQYGPGSKGDLFPNLITFDINTGKEVARKNEVFELDYGEAGEAIFGLGKDRLLIYAVANIAHLATIDVRTGAYVQQMEQVAGCMHMEDAGNDRIIVNSAISNEIMSLYDLKRVDLSKEKHHGWINNPDQILTLSDSQRYVGYSTHSGLGFRDLSTGLDPCRVYIQSRFSPFCDAFLLLEEGAGFDDIRSTVLKVISEWNINVIATRVNVITYGDKAQFVSRIDKQQNGDKLLVRLQQHKAHVSASPKLAAALALVRSEGQALLQTGDERYKEKYVFVFGRQPSAQEVKQECEALRTSGYHLLALWGGEKASAVSNDTWLWTKHIDSFKDVSDDVVELVSCNANMTLSFRTTALLSSQLAVVALNTGSVVTLDLEAGRVLHKILKYPNYSRTSLDNTYIRHVVIGKQELAAILGENKDKVGIFDVVSGSQLHCFETVRMCALRTNPEQTLLLGFPDIDGTDNKAGKLIVWDLKKRQLLVELRLEARMGLNPYTMRACYAFGPGSTHLYVAGATTGYCFDLSTGKYTEFAQYHHTGVSMVFYSKALDAIVANYYAENMDFHILEPVTLQLRKLLRGPRMSYMIQQAYMSPEGRLLVVNNSAVNSYLVLDLISEQVVSVVHSETSVLSASVSLSGGCVLISAFEIPHVVQFIEHDPSGRREREDKLMEKEPELFKDGKQKSTVISLTDIFH